MRVCVKPPTYRGTWFDCGTNNSNNIYSAQYLSKLTVFLLCRSSSGLIAKLLDLAWLLIDKRLPKYQSVKQHPYVVYSFCGQPEPPSSLNIHTMNVEAVNYNEIANSNKQMLKVHWRASFVIVVNTSILLRSLVGVAQTIYGRTSWQQRRCNQSGRNLLLLLPWWMAAAAAQLNGLHDINTTKSDL